MTLKNKKNNNIKTYNLLFVVLLPFLLLLFPHCAKEEKKIEDLSFQELKQKTLSALQNNKYKDAIQPLDTIISQHSERPDISKYKLLLANSYFETGNLPAAHQMYEHFTQFYPSDKKTEYAMHQAIRSKFYQTLLEEQ